MVTSSRTFVCCNKYYLKNIHVLLCEKRGEENLFTHVVSRCAASVSLSAVGVSSDDQSGRGWVEKNIGREGRGRKTERGEKRFNLCLDNAALSRQIIIHEPIYIIPCTGTLSYHSHALKYQFLSTSLSHPPLLSLYQERRLCLCDWQKKLRVASSIERPGTRCEGFAKLPLMCDARQHFRYAQYEDMQSSECYI